MTTVGDQAIEKASSQLTVRFARNQFLLPSASDWWRSNFLLRSATQLYSFGYCMVSYLDMIQDL